MDTTHRATTTATPEVLLATWRADGDAGALAALFDATAPELFRLAMLLAPDAATAEDVLQETFVAAIESVDRFDAQQRAVPWLVGILRNKAAMVRRSAARVVDPSRLADRTPRDPAEDASVAEQRARVRHAIEQMSEPYRSVALLRWCYDLTPAEIAHVRGEPPGTVRSTLTRALRDARRRLGALAVVFLPAGRPLRGLEAIRAAVIDRSRRLRPVPAAPLAMAGGVLAMSAKKLVAGAAVALLLAALGVALWPTAPESDRPEGRVDRPPSSGRAPQRAHAPQVVEVANEQPASFAAGPQLRGHVVDQEGRPVAGARVAARSDRVGVGPWSFSDMEHLPASASSDGSFAVPATGDPPFLVAATAAGFGLTVRSGARPGRDVTLVLDREAALVGRVMTVGREPVAGAVLRLRVTRFAGNVGGGTTTEHATVSDADGAYRLSGLQPFDWSGSREVRDSAALSLRVTAEGFPPLVLANSPIPGSQAVPNLPEGGEGRLDVYLGRGAVLEGVVVDEATGAPIGGALVGVASRSGFTPLEPAGRTMTAADGTFRIERVPAWGVYRPDGAAISGPMRPWVYSAAWKEGYAPSASPLPTCRDGDTLRVTLKIATPAAVEGLVAQEDGVPAAGVEVTVMRGVIPYGIEWVRRLFPEMPARTRSATTDAEGRYRIEGLAPPSDAGRDTPLRAATATSHAEAHVDLIAGRTVSAPDLVLRPLPAFGWADVLVLDEAGIPVAGAEVHHRSGTPRTRFLARSDAAGRCRVDDGPGPRMRAVRPEECVGPVRLLVRATGFVPAPVELTFGRGDVPESRVVLSEGRTVSGRVRYDDGSPAVGAWVFVLHADVSLDDAFSRSEFHAARSGTILGKAAVRANGSFDVEELPTGPYVVAARTAEHGGAFGMLVEVARSVVRDVPSDAQGIVLVVPTPAAVAPRGVRVSGRVVDADTGQPFVGFDVSVDSEADRVSGAEMAPGEFRIDDVPPGEWTLRVGAARYGTAAVPVTAMEGRDTDPLVVKMRRGSVVRGVLRRPPTHRDARAQVRLYGEGEPPTWGGLSAPIAPDGTFTLSGVGAGRWRAVVSAQDGARVSSLHLAGGWKVDVPEGAKGVELDDDLVLGGDLLVWAEDPRFAPLQATTEPPAEQVRFSSRSRVLVRSSDGGIVATATGLRVSNQPSLRASLPPGRYVVRLERPDTDPTEQTVDLVAGTDGRVFIGR